MQRLHQICNLESNVAEDLAFSHQNFATPFIDFKLGFNMQLLPLFWDWGRRRSSCNSLNFVHTIKWFWLSDILLLIHAANSVPIWFVSYKFWRLMGFVLNGYLKGLNFVYSFVLCTMELSLDIICVRCVENNCLGWPSNRSIYLNGHHENPLSRHWPLQVVWLSLFFLKLCDIVCSWIKRGYRLFPSLSWLYRKENHGVLLSKQAATVSSRSEWASPLLTRWVVL